MSEPLTRCRKRIGDVETGVLTLSQDKVQRVPLLTVWMASGMQVA
ncbi:MAG: hypothetical protein ABSH25_14830 [Syntrophorhabdales bacterium]